MDENELLAIAAAIGGALIGCALGAILMLFFY
jgi:hypothetical protein